MRKARVRTTSTSTSPSQGSLVRSGTKIIYTAGRPPWYDSHGQLKEAFVIGKIRGVKNCFDVSGLDSLSSKI